MGRPGPEDVCAFWFGELDAEGRATKETSARWFQKDPQFDALVRDRFHASFEAALAGELDAWRRTPLGALGLILILDQFTRNMFRDQPQMFAGDSLALTVAKEALATHLDADMGVAERTFFRMPLMHSESIDDQNACVEAFGKLHSEYLEARRPDLATIIENNVRYAVAHRDIVAKWGRFPHRNAILGRASTPAELAFLKEPGSSF